MPTPGQPALKAALLSIFQDLDNSKTADQAADEIATAIDSHIAATTTTVTGTAVGALGGGPGVPVTGTGVI